MRRGNGFATFTSVVITAVVAIGVMGLLLTLRVDVKRTRAATQSAQLRQMLIAGAAEADALLRAAPSRTGEHPVALPDTLADLGATASCTFEPMRGDRKRVAVTAALNGGTARQVLTYETGPGGWVFVSAELERSP